MGTQAVETDFQGPLDKDCVGLVLGRSSSTMKGLFVLPGVIDPDYTGVVKVMCWSPRGIISIAPGDRIAQLLVLRSAHNNFPAENKDRGNQGFGSTGVDLACLSVNLDHRPMVTLEIEGRQFSGLLDTGADRSIIRRQDWPKRWPTQQASQSLQGLGYQNTPDVSARSLSWRMEEQSGTFQPFVVDLPLSLWGRDVQQQMGLKLTNEFSKGSQQIMKDQGYFPGRGLGSRLQGIASPIEATGKTDRSGLGFS